MQMAIALSRSRMLSLDGLSNRTPPGKLLCAGAQQISTNTRMYMLADGWIEQGAVLRPVSVLYVVEPPLHRGQISFARLY